MDHKKLADRLLMSTLVVGSLVMLGSGAYQYKQNLYMERQNQGAIERTTSLFLEYLCKNNNICYKDVKKSQDLKK